MRPKPVALAAGGGATETGAVIIFVYGTTAELIKLAPIVRRLSDLGLPYLDVTTQQQPEQVLRMHEEFGFRPPDIILSDGAGGDDLARKRDLPGWALAVGLNFARAFRSIRRRLASEPGEHLLMVHGDTFTTVLGALMGRLLGLPVAHLEAGMRTSSWRHPFPEELNRRAVGRIAGIHYAPTQLQVENLGTGRGAVCLLGANTARDALELIPDEPGRLTEILGRPVPGGEFGVVSLHRFELLADRARLTAIVELLAERSRRTPLLFVDHPVTAARLSEYRLDDRFDGECFVRIPRVGYFPFITLLRRSAYLVTDSGGGQVESFYLDLPCLIHRRLVEQNEGLGRNVVVSGFDLDVVRDFLADPARWRAGAPPELPVASDLVVADLRGRGVWSRPGPLLGAATG